MNGRHLLDTNIVIALLAGEADTVAQLREADEVFIPSVVLGELYFGASKSGRAVENLQRIDELAAESAVIVIDERTARHGNTALSRTNCGTKDVRSLKTMFGSPQSRVSTA